MRFGRCDSRENQNWGPCGSIFGLAEPPAIHVEQQFDRKAPRGVPRGACRESMQGPTPERSNLAHQLVVRGTAGI